MLINYQFKTLSRNFRERIQNVLASTAFRIEKEPQRTSDIPQEDIPKENAKINERLERELREYNRRKMVSSNSF